MLSRDQHQPGQQLSLEVNPARNRPGRSSPLLCWGEGCFLPDGHFGGTNALPRAGGPDLVAQEEFVLATGSVHGAGAKDKRLCPSHMGSRARAVFLVLGPRACCSSCFAAEVLLVSWYVPHRAAKSLLQSPPAQGSAVFTPCPWQGAAPAPLPVGLEAEQCDITKGVLGVFWSCSSPSCYSELPPASFPSP